MENKIKTNNLGSKGFVTVIFSILLSLYLLILGVSYALIVAIDQDTWAYSLCYKTAARLQHELKSHLKKILKLNPEFERLRKYRKAADFALKQAWITNNPILIQIARYAVKKVRNRQKSLDEYRQLILKRSLSSIQKNWKRFKTKSSPSLQDIYKEKKWNPLALQKKYPEDEYSSYEIAQPFSENQAITIYWKMDHLRNLPQFLKNIFRLNQLSKHYCKVSLEEAGPEDFFITLMK